MDNPVTAVEASAVHAKNRLITTVKNNKWVVAAVLIALAVGMYVGKFGL